MLSACHQSARTDFGSLFCSFLKSRIWPRPEHKRAILLVRALSLDTRGLHREKSKSPLFIRIKTARLHLALVYDGNNFDESCFCIGKLPGALNRKRTKGPQIHGCFGDEARAAHMVTRKSFAQSFEKSVCIGVRANLAKFADGTLKKQQRSLLSSTKYF